MHPCPSLTCGHAGGTVYIVGGRYTDGGLLNLPGQADLDMLLCTPAPSL